MHNHQYDCSFKLDYTTYVIECKRQTGLASKNQIYYFNSTISDHILGMRADRLVNDLRGIFLSTTYLDEKSMIYAITNGIKFITPQYPPLEFVLNRINRDSDLAKAITYLLSELPIRSPLFSEPIQRIEPAPEAQYQHYKDLLVWWRYTSKNGSR
jgi:hypothetical protein